MSDTATVITALLQHPPIAYHRSFATIAGGVTPGLMLSQMWYWTKIQFRGNEEWFWKTQEQWNEETGLTRTEQENARKTLKAKGFISEERRGNPAKLYFRLNTQCVVKALETSLESSVCMKPANKIAGNLQTRLRETCNLYKEAETTTESTSETIKPKPMSSASQNDGGSSGKLFPDSPKKVSKPEFVLPDWIPAELWKDFEDMRRSIKKPLGPRAKALAVSTLVTLKQAGHSPVDVINQSILNCWAGLFAIKGDYGGYQSFEKPVVRQKSPSEQLREQGIVPGGRSGR